MDEGNDSDAETPEHPRRRRPATMREAKALAHPLRIRIIRLCTQRDLTNKQLADRLERDPGTVLHHVRQLVAAGFLEQAAVRTGETGALEKPYRSTGLSWWLDNPLGIGEPETVPAVTGHTDGAGGNGVGDVPAGADSTEPALAPVDAFVDELREAGSESIRTFARFALHLSPEDVAELDRRILAVLDEYVETDDQRRDHPLHGGLIVLHHLAE
ncbi:transcriptional regulator [Streptomyces sp. ST2-7A]|uniref:ArsR/SmtB family transcription factor n=1 Tax=Streptomyces sp. ST2-7A TaxID=2907214 RepID=UPI001F3B47AA|nr:winged helix-turn-helix domain-containing protein [Streptomyces sp. ST2-7A]MCE7080658.1 winged helix-turn-helix domain-containing protein [Streptomyces sp. ST2-7A]